MNPLSLAGAVALALAVAACGTRSGGQAAEPAGSGSATAVRAHSAVASPAGRATAGGPAPAWPSASPPVLTGPAVLTVADRGAVVRLRPGQRVTVALAAQGLFSWHVPAAAGVAVRRASASGGYPGRRPARAMFVAVRPGRAALTATDDTACLHTRPACAPGQQEWRVTVVVADIYPAR
jgi:hypothetical protein